MVQSLEIMMRKQVWRPHVGKKNGSEQGMFWGEAVREEREDQGPPGVNSWGGSATHGSPGEGHLG